MFPFQKSIIKVLGLWILTCGISFSQQQVTSITNLTISPSNPTPGQTITISWTYTIPGFAGTSPDAIVAVSSSSTLQAANTANQWVVLGDNCLPEAGTVGGGCYVGPANSTTTNYSTTVTIPSGLTPGMTYYVIVGMRASGGAYMNPSVTLDPGPGSQTYVSFTVPLPPPYVNLNVVADGPTAFPTAPGNQVLFTINYSAGAATNISIADSVDPNFTIVQVFNGGTWIGQNITWPAMTLSTPGQGQVQFLAQLTGSQTSGQVIPDTATATFNTSSSTTSIPALVTVDEPGLTISKSAPPTVAANGGPITYVINYTNTGLALNTFQNFANGIPGGWTTSGNMSGCNWDTNPGYLEESVTCSLCNTYPYLSDTGGTPMLDGVYQVDMMINSMDCNNFEAVFNFNINVSGGTTYVYQAHLSANKGYNGWNSAALSYDQSVNGNPSTSNQFKSPPNMGTPQENAWYTVKIQVCSGQVMMKVWPQGTTEPGAWDINYTAAPTSTTIPQVAGIFGFQSNAGPVGFANLLVFNTVGATAPVITDNVPPNVSYVGAGNSGSQSSGLITWAVNTTCGNSSAVSWWGTADACGNPITNAAVISCSNGPAPVTSNAVTTLISGCNTSTFTVTATPTSTSTPTMTQTPPLTYTQTDTPTITQTPTPTDTPTATNTSTFTPTATQTYTPTQTSTNTFTPSSTETSTSTSTSTVTPTFTSTSTPTNSFTPTITPTVTLTPTITISPTVTLSPTPTLVPQDNFFIGKNVFVPAPNAPLSIYVGCTQYPGPYSLRVYNSAGEFIRDLSKDYGDPSVLAAPVTHSYFWDGTDYGNNQCVSGVYLFYLIEPFDRHLKKVVLIH
jgi:hypothetical protein